MLISSNLHKESSEVSIKTRSLPASLSFKGQASGQAAGLVRAKEDVKVRKYQDLVSEVSGMCVGKSRVIIGCRIFLVIKRNEWQIQK